MVKTEIVNFKFSPNPVVIKVGATIEWENHDSAPHTSTWIPGASTAEQWDSGILSHGQTFRRTFTKVGNYFYWCDIHNSITGTVAVTETGEAPASIPMPAGATTSSDPYNY